MGLIFSIAATSSGAPVTGLTLADFSVDVHAVQKSDSAKTSPVSAAAMTLEAGGGHYIYSNPALNSDTHFFFVYVQYTGATSLDTDHWLIESPQNIQLELMVRGGQTDQSLDSLRIQSTNIYDGMVAEADFDTLVNASLANYDAAKSADVDAAVTAIRGDDVGATLVAIHSLLGIVANHTEKVRGVTCGELKILDNQLILYDEDGDEIYRYNLYNKEGLPAESSVYERRIV